jgi:plasmid stabilization system protein ParE
MYRIVITQRAEDEIQSAHDWWGEQYSKATATQWFIGIYEAIASLATMPERCPLASEQLVKPLVLRQLHFGLGSRPTHRVVFLVDDSEVVVLTVRHASQDALSSKDV